MKYKFAALAMLIAVSGCQQSNSTTEHEISELEVRVSNLEAEQKVSAELPKPIVREKFELLGLPGPRRFYENRMRCMDALEAVAQAEDKQDRENQATVGTVNAGGSRIMAVGSVKHVLSCSLA